MQSDTRPLGRGSRLAFNEQLRLFGTVKDSHRSGVPVRTWAALALVLVIVPWALVGWTIWLLT
jgi:hypothetical protein